MDMLTVSTGNSGRRIHARLACNLEENKEGLANQERRVAVIEY
jgi:hypothetical protein